MSLFVHPCIIPCLALTQLVPECTCRQLLRCDYIHNRWLRGHLPQNDPGQIHRVGDNCRRCGSRRHTYFHHQVIALFRPLKPVLSRESETCGHVSFCSINFNYLWMIMQRREAVQAESQQDLEGYLANALSSKRTMSSGVMGVCTCNVSIDKNLAGTCVFHTVKRNQTACIEITEHTAVLQAIRNKEYVAVLAVLCVVELPTL